MVGRPSQRKLISKGMPHVHLDYADPVGSPRVWPNPTPRRVVDSTADRVPRIVDLHCLRDVGGVSGRSLSLRTVRLAILFAGDFRSFAAQLVRTQASRVAGVAPVLSGPDHSPDPGVLPIDLLLLPR